MESSKKETAGNLLSVLRNIQNEFGYLPEEKLREVAESLKLSLIDVYGVATFYRSFSLTPRGRHHIKVCLGTACHVRGSNRVLEEAERKVGIQPGQTSENGDYSLETVMCLGCCAIGPVVVMDGKYHGQVKPGDVGSITRAPGE